MKLLTRHSLLLIATVIYLLGSAGIVYRQYNYITTYQYRSMGLSALNMAELAAEALSITDADVTALEALTFTAAQSHPANLQLKKLFELVAKNDSVKYAYLLRKLPEYRVRYQVTADDASFYELPAGTALDYIWLLDVIVAEDQQQVVNGIADYYKDKNRYTTKHDRVADLLKEQAAGYLLSEGEWGTQISGLTPVYTTEGSYVGLMGVDMYSASFFAYRTNIFRAFMLLVIIPAVFLSALYVYLLLRYRQRMNNLAYRDQLTGLFNRRYFDLNGKKLFETAVKKHTVLGLIIGDIDDFKQYNDLYGHLEGDAALKTVAQNILAAAAGTAGFTARYGGEEFIVMLSEAADIEALCADICRSVATAELQRADGGSSRLTISLGACLYQPGSGESLESLINQADRKLYQAKKAGKNTFAC